VPTVARVAPRTPARQAHSSRYDHEVISARAASCDWLATRRGRASPRSCTANATAKSLPGSSVPIRPGSQWRC